jgi:sulfide:quinone oxidoreductase
MGIKRVLILGAGAAGTIVANKLARELRREIAKGEVEVTILDKNTVNTNQAGFTFIPFGLYTPGDITMPRWKLISPRVKAILGADGEVSHLDLQNREVTARSGRKYTYDYLLIATGCVPDVESVPGLSRDFNTFFTSLEDAQRVGDFVKTVEKGRVVILTVGMPIPCPGAPGKFAVLLDDYLRYVRGGEVRKKIEISFLWPIEMIGPPAYNAVVSQVFEDKGIADKRNFKLSEIDAGKKEVVSAEGERIGYDFLISVPPFTSPKALSDSGLTDEKGWLPADKYTLQYRRSPTESYEEVYVVGDAGPAEILKTGIGAHYQALITAQNLINDILGNGVKVPYRGETGCPIIKSSYTPSTRGEAYIASWTYGKPLEAVNPTGLGWFLYRAYYYIYWDTAMKGLI